MKVSSQGLPANSSTRLIALQRLLDPVLIVGLLLILSYPYQVNFDRDYLLLAAATCLLSFSAFGLAGRYRLECEQTFAWEMPRIITGWAIVLALLLFLGYSTKSSSGFSRSLLLSWAACVPIALYILHLLMQRLQAWLRQSAHNSRTAVVVGIGELGRYLSEQIRTTPQFGIKFCGFFDDKFPSIPNAAYTGRVLLGKVEKLSDYVRQNRIDVVFITAPISDHSLERIIKELQDTTACVYFVPNILMFNLMQARTHQINGIPLIAIWENPFYDLQSDFKRVLDIIIAGFALLIFSPLMSAIAIAVKLSSPGPILFKQRRYGLNGQEILIYKFRSMTVMEDGSEVKQAQRNDNRVTAVGAFLRKTSLDELPQFINVLQGRMSVVGPRPHAVAHNETYRKLISGYMLRHKVKPGITGWAQIHGFRGETDTLEKMKKRVEYDLEYFRNWSLALDLQIIFRTAFIFFNSRNAY
jgi:putative colanic acid biosynthesis UDP-glucose lipid carrier transferase